MALKQSQMRFWILTDQLMIVSMNLVTKQKIGLAKLMVSSSILLEAE